MKSHVVLLSGGKDSTALALRLAETRPDIDWRYLCTPTGDELPPMVEHWNRLADMLGKPIERAIHPRGLSGLIADFDALPNWRMRWCTRVLKIETAVAWYARNAPCIAYVGLRADESERTGLLYESVPQVFPMREWGWTIRDVREYLIRRGVTVPTRTDCARCYHQRIGEWWNLWLDWPAIFADAEGQEAATGHTFRSPGRDTWPVALADLRAEFEGGRIPRRADRNRDLFNERAGQCRACTL